MVTAAYSERFDDAVTLAVIAHHGQVRKRTRVPYAMHPFQVATILGRHGYAEDVQIAGLLHDVLEDMRPEDAALREALRETFDGWFEHTPDEPDAFARRVRELVAERFGARVLELVEAVTEQKKDAAGVEIPWKDRKRRTEEILRRDATPADAVALKAADALHNAWSVTRDLEAHGLAMMQRFNATPEETFRNYAAVLAVVRARLGAGVPLAEELSAAVARLGEALERRVAAAHDDIVAIRRELAGRG